MTKCLIDRYFYSYIFAIAAAPPRIAPIIAALVGITAPFTVTRDAVVLDVVVRLVDVLVREVVLLLVSVVEVRVEEEVDALSPVVVEVVLPDPVVELVGVLVTVVIEDTIVSVIPDTVVVIVVRVGCSPVVAVVSGVPSVMVRVVVTEMVTVPPGPPVCTETIVSVTVAVPGLCVGFGFFGGGCFGG